MTDETQNIKREVAERNPLVEKDGGRIVRKTLCTFHLSPFTLRGAAGFSLVEVMAAMAILAAGILGVMGVFQWADKGLLLGVDSMRALALVESRLEAKRTGPWTALLIDDVDGDGKADVIMRDDGTHGDERAGDGTYTASVDRDGIHLVWTVQPDRPGLPHRMGSVLITARARYSVGREQWGEIEIGTLRANPNYIGWR